MERESLLVDLNFTPFPITYSHNGEGTGRQIFKCVKYKDYVTKKEQVVCFSPAMPLHVCLKLRISSLNTFRHFWLTALS